MYRYTSIECNREEPKCRTGIVKEDRADRMDASGRTARGAANGVLLLCQSLRANLNR